MTIVRMVLGQVPVCLCISELRLGNRERVLYCIRLTCRRWEALVIPEPSFTLGIEEEYLLVDRETRDLIKDAPPTMMSECEKLLEEQVKPEFLQSQIEIGTRVCSDLSQARTELAHLRRCVAEVAGRHGLAIIAASTHPFAMWEAQKHTAKERYEVLARDLQAVAQRLLISGMHVHVGIEDNDLRIDLMGQASYILPHLLVLSTSSPFWQGMNTGLKSYRLAVWRELPRSGLPPRFDSFAEFQRHLDVLVKAGVIEDGTKVWWDIRPSVRFPTLEMRITDICTRLEDAISIAALYRCWLRMLYRLRLANQRWRAYSNFLIDENRWRAQRYGFEEGLIDFGKGEIVAYGDLLEELLGLVAEDAEYFGCVSEAQHARRILERGTSAHRQISTYEGAKAQGASHEDALRAVVDMLVAETLHGI
jgi:carboxylate-amine ligase